MSAAVTADLVWGLRPLETAELVTTQLALAGYRARPESLPPGPDHTYDRNEDLWQAVLRGAPAARVVTLRGFLLSEWLPFLAGAFHTPYGTEQRRMAQQQVLYDGSRPDATAPGRLRGIDPRTLGAGRIYSSAGKGGMIAGGVGSVRLKPRRIDAGEVWFLAASSSSAPHEGFPVAVPTALYAGLADELHAAGAVRCTLTGELRFVERELRGLFGARVPQVYLLVAQLRRERGPAPDVVASVPVSFQSRDGTVHAAYARFRPGRPGSLERAADWLEHTYAGTIYDGRVVTDFDERVSWFADGDFTLERVMAGTLRPDEAAAAAGRLQLGGHVTNVIVERVELNGTLVAERIEAVHQDRVITIGAGAQVNAPVVIADSIENSFNTVQASQASAEVKELFAELAAAVAAAARAAPPAQAETMGGDLETLAREVTRETPRREWCRLSMQGLRDAAQTLGEVGTPVLTVTAKLAELLG